MKTYKVTWLNDEGEVTNLGEYTTEHPKEILFNHACIMICTASNHFQKFEKDNIWDAIHTGKTKREHLFIIADGMFGEQVLSIMEVL